MRERLGDVHMTSVDVIEADVGQRPSRAAAAENNSGPRRFVFRRVDGLFFLPGSTSAAVSVNAIYQRAEVSPYFNVRAGAALVESDYSRVTQLNPDFLPSLNTRRRRVRIETPPTSCPEIHTTLFNRRDVAVNTCIFKVNTYIFKHAR